MEDGDLWQTYGDIVAPRRAIPTHDKVMMDSDNATTSPDDTKSESDPAGLPEECPEEDSAVTSTTATAYNKVDVGPPVNIYAEAHRHAQIKTSDANNNIDGAAVVDEQRTDNVREGPHASLHLSSELKQNQKKLSHDNDAKVSDSSMAETTAPDQEAAVGVSSDDAHNDDDAAKELPKQTTTIDDDSTAASAPQSTSDSPVDGIATEEDSTATTTVTTKQPNRTRTVSEDEEDDEGPTKRILVDYASKLAGAQVLEKSPSFKGASNLLTGDSDKYAIAPCEDKKYVVIGLSEDILVKQIKLSNYERYSSHVREFQVLASQEYPAPSAEYWTLIGTFEANPRNGEQTFELEEPAWARYLKFKFKSHFGAEHYCTLSQIKVHGSTMLQGFHEQWIESEKELEQEKMMEKENQQLQQQQQPQGGNQQGDIDDSNDEQQHQHQENAVVVDGTSIEESSGVDKKRDHGDEDEIQLEPIAADSHDNRDDKTEDNVAGIYPPDEEISEVESPPISDEVIESKQSSSSYADEEPTGKGEGALVSTGDNPSIARDETVPDQQVVNKVPLEATGGDVTLGEETHEKNFDREPAKSPDKPNQLSETDVADEVNQADSDVKPTLDDNVAVPLVETHSVDATPNASLAVKPDEEAIPSDAAVATNDSNDKDAVETSTSIKEGHIHDGKNPNETQETTNKTSDTTASKTNPASIDKKTDKTVSSHSGVTSAQDPAKRNDSSDTIDPPAPKSIEKDVVATTSLPAEKNDVKVAVVSSSELIAKLSKRFPHASCIKDLDFHAFKSRTLLANAGQSGQVPGAKGSGQVPGPKMEPIFAKITNEIKSVQMTQHQYEQYISAVKTCYEKLFLDMTNDLDSIQRDYDRRLSNLEDALSHIVPGVLPKPRDYRFMAFIPTLAALSTWECARLVLSVSFTTVMIFLQMRRNKMNLKKHSKSALKTTEDITPSTLPAKEATPLAAPSPSLAEVSPSAINNVTKNYDKQTSQNCTTSTEPALLQEHSERGHSCDQPTLVRIISSEEKENKSSKQYLRGKEFSGDTSAEEENSTISPPLGKNGQIARDFRVTC